MFGFFKKSPNTKPLHIELSDTYMNGQNLATIDSFLAALKQKMLDENRTKLVYGQATVEEFNKILFNRYGFMEKHSIKAMSFAWETARKRTM